MRCTALGIAILVACSGPEAEPPPAVASDPAVVELEAALAEYLVTAPVAMAELRRTFRMPANVKLDPMKVSYIDSGVRARIVKVYVQRGTQVEVGASLAVLISPQLTRAQVDFLGALADLELQRRAVTRAVELLDAEVISKAELERRRARLFLAKTEVKSRRSQLELMGMGAREIDSIEETRTILDGVTIHSPTFGTVIERRVAREQIVETGELMFTIADLSRVRVEGEAPARAINFLSSADHLLIEIPAIGGEPIRGKRLHVGAVADRDTRTVTVRTEIDNPRAAIKPEMLATLVVVGPEQSSLTVPSSAVVREANRDYVFVQEASARYRLAEVDLEPEVEGVRAVSQGLREGDRVVVDGALRLNTERKRRAGQGS